MKLLAFIFACGLAIGQTQQGSTVAATGATFDLSTGAVTRPMVKGTVLPITCSTGDQFFKTNSTAGQNLYGCIANVWTQQAGGGGGGGGSGGVQCTSVTVSGAFSLDWSIGLGGSMPCTDIEVNLSGPITSVNLVNGSSRLSVKFINGGTGFSVTGTAVNLTNWCTPSALANKFTIQNILYDNTNYDGNGCSSNDPSVVPVSGGGTGLTSGTSGGIPCYTAPGTIASSIALGAGLPVIGGGAGACPTTGTISGTGSELVTTTGPQTTGAYVQIDANGNHIAGIPSTGNPAVLFSGVATAGSATFVAASSPATDTTIFTYVLPALTTGDKVCYDAIFVHSGTATSFILKQKLGATTLTTTSALSTTAPAVRFSTCIRVTGASSTLFDSFLSTNGLASADGGASALTMFPAGSTAASGANLVLSANFGGATADTIVVGYFEITKYAKTP